MIPDPKAVLFEAIEAIVIFGHTIVLLFVFGDNAGAVPIYILSDCPEKIFHGTREAKNAPLRYRSPVLIVPTRLAWISQ